MVFDNFDLDLKYGSAGEQFVAELFLSGRDGHVPIEVKRDAKFLDTGNFYVETECRGRDGIWRDSGLRISGAKYWALVFGDTPAVLLVSAKMLRWAVIVSGRKAEHLTGENPTRGVLVNIDELRSAGSAYK